MPCINHRWDGDVARFSNGCNYAVSVFYCFKGPARVDASCARGEWGVEPIKANGDAWLGAYEVQNGSLVNKGGYSFVTCRQPGQVANWKNFSWNMKANTFECGQEDSAGGDSVFVSRYQNQMRILRQRGDLDQAALNAKRAQDDDGETAADAIRMFGTVIESIARSRQGGGGGGIGHVPNTRSPCLHRNVERC